MQYIKGIENYQNTNATAITLGKFDGLHLGHEFLVEKVIEHQMEDQVDSVVFAFDMSPLFEKMNKKYERLLSNKEKAERLKGRVDYFVDCPFVDSISKMSAEEFIEKILVGIFHAKYIVVGTDFRFGYQRKGDISLLQKYSSVYGYKLEVVSKLVYQGREISSTFIKEELNKGNLEMVNRLLGYSYNKMNENI